jgi:hypothetical protein
MYSPIDMPKGKHYGSNYWVDKSFKYNRMVSSYSDLEYDNWILIETDPKIQAYCEQPLRIVCICNGKKSETVFDMWVKNAFNQEEIIEVKYNTELQPKHPKYEKNMRQIETQKKWCLDNDITHSIKTDVEIRGNRILLDNKKRILSFVKNIDQSTLLDSNQFMSLVSVNPISFTLLKETISDITPYQLQENVFWHIYHGNIESNIGSTILGNGTEVWNVSTKIN